MPKVGLKFIKDNERRALIKETLDLLLQEFGENLLSAVVFGSVARGEETSASDIDILIIGKDLPESLSDRMDRLAKVLVQLDETQTSKKMRKKNINTWIQFHALNSDEAKLHRPIYLDMVEDGVIIFDKNKFIETILSGFGKKLKQLGAKRVFLKDGSWYWDLKPDIKRGEIVEI